MSEAEKYLDKEGIKAAWPKDLVTCMEELLTDFAKHIIEVSDEEIEAMHPTANPESGNAKRIEGAKAIIQTQLNKLK